MDARAASKTPLMTDEAMGTWRDFVVQVIEQHGGKAEIELCTFSGNVADIEQDAQSCRLRLTSTTELDGDGNGHERMGRLAGIGGRWVIPPLGVVTEVVLLSAKSATGFSCGWVLWGAQQPPGKLAMGTAYTFVSDDTTELFRGLAHVFKSKFGTTFGVDPATGNFQITLANSTRLTLAQDAIELAVMDDSSPPQPKSAFRIDRDGIGLLSGGNIVARWDGNAGTFTQVASGACSLAHPGIGFGPNPTIPVAVGAGTPAPSTMLRTTG